MRNFMTTVALAAALTIGSISIASAAAPTTGNAVIDAVLADYYVAVEAACAPVGGGASAAACQAALVQFAALTDPAALAAVPAIAAAIAAGELSLVDIQTATAGAAFADSFLAANTALADVITEANAGNPEFLAAINEALNQTVGAGTAGGPAVEASPTAL